MELLPSTLLSANVVLLQGKNPLLLDSGYITEQHRTLDWLKTHTAPESLQAVVNTHWHSDHVGANDALQALGVPLWAHEDEKQYLCQPEWLQHPSYNFTPSQFLHEGEILNTGEMELQVIHTPGHSDGHCSFYLPEQKVLLWGDLVIFGKDIAWLWDDASLQRMIQSFEKLLHYPATQALSGHGGWMNEPHAVLQRGLSRLQSWAQKPEDMYWHAMKRIFVYHIIQQGSSTFADLDSYFAVSPWLKYFSGKLKTEPQHLSTELLTHLQQSGILKTIEGRVYAT